MFHFQVSPTSDNTFRKPNQHLLTNISGNFLTQGPGYSFDSRNRGWLLGKKEGWCCIRGLYSCLWHCMAPWPHQQALAHTAGQAEQAKMSIYQDNLSAIVIDDNLLPLIFIAKNSLDLSITDIAFIIYFVINYRDKRFFMHTVFKASELAL